MGKGRKAERRLIEVGDLVKPRKSSSWQNGLVLKLWGKVPIMEASVLTESNEVVTEYVSDLKLN